MSDFVRFTVTGASFVKSFTISDDLKGLFRTEEVTNNPQDSLKYSLCKYFPSKLFPQTDAQIL